MNWKCDLCVTKLIRLSQLWWNKEDKERKQHMIFGWVAVLVSSSLSNKHWQTILTTFKGKNVVRLPMAEFECCGHSHYSTTRERSLISNYRYKNSCIIALSFRYYNTLANTFHMREFTLDAIPLFHYSHEQKDNRKDEATDHKISSIPYWLYRI